MSHELSQIFQVDEITDVGVDSEGERIYVYARLKKERRPCPRCGNTHVNFRDRKQREFHLPPVGSKRATLRLDSRRNHCISCKHTWWPALSFARGKQRMTQSFVNHILDLMKMGTVKDVADHLGIGWDTVKTIHKDFLRNEYAEIDIEDIKYVSVDEFSIRKGHTYMTIFSDIKTGRIIHAVEGRKKKNIIPFLKELKKSPILLEL